MVQVDSNASVVLQDIRFPGEGAPTSFHQEGGTAARAAADDGRVLDFATNSGILPVTIGSEESVTDPYLQDVLADAPRTVRLRD